MGTALASANDAPTAFEQLLENATVSSSRVFALDFSQDGSDGALHLGGIDDEYAESIVWAESQAVDDGFFHTVTLFNMSVCGVPLCSNWSSHWEALVDTGATCLTLPAEFYDVLMAWVPACSDTNTGERCYVENNDAAIAALPHIAFQLKEYGTPLYISLASLLLDTGSSSSSLSLSPESTATDDDADANRELCVLRGGQIATSDGLYMQTLPRISFGSLVLRSLYAAFDLDAPRVGFAAKTSPLDGEEGRCLSATCTGEQQLDRTTNACLNPSCEDFFFQEIDPTSLTTCRYKPPFHEFICFAIIFFTASELLIFFGYKSTLQQLLGPSVNVWS
jgi:hypothetical protein